MLLFLVQLELTPNMPVQPGLRSPIGPVGSFSERIGAQGWNEEPEWSRLSGSELSNARKKTQKDRAEGKQWALFLELR